MMQKFEQLRIEKGGGEVAKKKYMKQATKVKELNVSKRIMHTLYGREHNISRSIINLI